MFSLDAGSVSIINKREITGRAVHEGRELVGQKRVQQVSLSPNSTESYVCVVPWLRLALRCGILFSLSTSLGVFFI